MKGAISVSYINHFGIRVMKKNTGIKLTRENYIERIVFKSPRSKRYFTDSITEVHRERSLTNFDMNMKYFKALSSADFNEVLESFLMKNKSFEEIHDLNTVDRKPGYYIMVLDEYSQAYIGTGENIKWRIQQHWSMQMYFDRLIFGKVANSILSINSFRALDTTRIYAYITSDTFDRENNYIEQFGHRYLLNRTRGGRLDGLWEAISHGKTRDLSP